MDIFKKLLNLQMLKRFKDEEDEIFTCLTEKYENYEIAKKEYLELYENFTDLVISVHQVQSVLKVSNFMNAEIPSRNQITNDDETRIAKNLSQPYFYYLPELNLSNIENITIDTKLIPIIFNYIERNKHVINNSTSLIRKSEVNMKLITPLTFDCLMDYFQITFVPDSAN